MSTCSIKGTRKGAASRSVRDNLRQRLPKLSVWLLVIVVAHSAPVHAHDIWLAMVKQAEHAVDTDLQIGLLIGEKDLPTEVLAFNPARVERLWLTTPLGVQEIAVTGPQVTLPAADHGNGTRTVAYIGKPAPSVLPAARFDDYLREEHLQSILLQRQPTADLATATDGSSLVSERFSRSLKLLLTDEGQALIDCPVGLPLELLVIDADDSEVVVKATFRGQPLAGVWVDRGAADGSVLAEGATDANGRVVLVRDDGGNDGDWVVRATHMLADNESNAEWRSWWATTAFRLTAAGISACADPAR